jgi:hypothetical protein
VPLLFEAYYNYLGHFTLMQNSTVDKMLQKVMSFEEADLENDIQDPSNPHSTFSLLYKILAQRQAFGLLDGIITGRDLLGHLVVAL